jgi:hypothetical protein
LPRLFFATDHDGNTPATVAAKLGHIDTLILLASVDIEALYAPSVAGQNAVSFLVSENDTDAIEAIAFVSGDDLFTRREAGDLFTRRDPATGEDLAHLCVHLRRPEILALYCENLGRLAADNQGHTPLHAIARLPEIDGAPLLAAIGPIAAQSGESDLVRIAAESNSGWFVRSFAGAVGVQDEALVVAVSMLHADFVDAYLTVNAASILSQRKCVAAVYPCIATDAATSMRILDRLGCTHMLLDHGASGASGAIGSGLGGLAACVSDLAMLDVLRHFSPEEIYGPDAGGNTLLGCLLRLGKSACVAFALSTFSRPVLAALKLANSDGETPMGIAAATHNLEAARNIHEFYAGHSTIIAGRIMDSITALRAIEVVNETHLAALVGLHTETLQFAYRWSYVLLDALNYEVPALEVAVFLIGTGAAAPLLEIPTPGLLPAFRSPQTIAALRARHTDHDLHMCLLRMCQTPDAAALAQSAKDAVGCFMLDCGSGFVPSPLIDDSAEKSRALALIGAFLAHTLVSGQPCALAMECIFHPPFLESVILTDAETDPAVTATRRGFESLVPPEVRAALRVVSSQQDTGLRINGSFSL